MFATKPTKHLEPDPGPAALPSVPNFAEMMADFESAQPDDVLFQRFPTSPAAPPDRGKGEGATKRDAGSESGSHAASKDGGNKASKAESKIVKDIDEFQRLYAAYSRLDVDSKLEGIREVVAEIKSTVEGLEARGVRVEEDGGESDDDDDENDLR